MFFPKFVTVTPSRPPKYPGVFLLQGATDPCGWDDGWAPVASCFWVLSLLDFVVVWFCELVMLTSFFLHLNARHLVLLGLVPRQPQSVRFFQFRTDFYFENMFTKQTFLFFQHMFAQQISNLFQKLQQTLTNQHAASSQQQNRRRMPVWRKRRLRCWA